MVEVEVGRFNDEVLSNAGISFCPGNVHVPVSFVDAFKVEIADRLLVCGDAVCTACGLKVDRIDGIGPLAGKVTR